MTDKSADTLVEPEPMPSNTPRTDAAIAKLKEGYSYAPTATSQQVINHARQLERELTAMRSRLAEAHKAYLKAKADLVPNV